MNKTINTIVSIVAVASLVLGYVAYNKTPDFLAGSQGPVGPQGERGPVGPAGRDGRDGVDGVTKVITQVVEKPASPTLGAVSGPDVFVPYWSVNGVRSYYYSNNTLAGASTTCSVQLPAATTTVTLASFYAARLASSTQVEIGIADTGFATTTRLVIAGTGAAPLPTGGGSVAVASSSILVGSSSGAPKFLNWKLGFNGITGSTPTTVGVCKAVLTEISI